MDILRKPLRYAVRACFAFVLCAAPVHFGQQRRPSQAVQLTSHATQLVYSHNAEYKKLWSDVLENASVETGVKLRNQAISPDGLPPSVVKALARQRRYQDTYDSTMGKTPADGRLISYKSGDPSSAQRSTCKKPAIISVNGNRSGAVFTPMADNNRYRIKGCFFGDAPGTVFLEPQAGTRQPGIVRPIAMQIDPRFGSWSDTQLSVQLDPGLTRLPDLPVTLAIYPLKGRRIELRGCRFIAVRDQPQLLTTIPSAWVSLDPSAIGSHSIRQLEYVSPTLAGTNLPDPSPAYSAIVIRSDREPFGVGKDRYDFTKLNSGWVLEAVQLQTYSISCPRTRIPTESLGIWKQEWTASGILVEFSASVCSFSTPSLAFTASLSQYGISVWVIGPAGTQPLGTAR